MSDNVFEYKLGRKPATHPVGYRLIDSYTSPLPTSPAKFDHTNGFNEFHMLGNGPDATLTVNNRVPVGDCAFVGTVNVHVIDAIETKEPIVFPSSDETVSTYLAYNHGHDVGANLNQLLAYWHRIGLPWDGKLPAYAALNYRDQQAFWDGVNAFGCGYLGIVVTETMMLQSQANEPWDLTGLHTDDHVLGGHCVVAIARDGDDGEVVTWGKRQKFTSRWFARNVEEAHVVLTSGQVAHKGDGYGIDLDHLQSDLKAIQAAGV